VVTRYSLAAAAFVAIVVAVTAARPARTPGLLARDFEAYWSAGATSNERADPYGIAIWNAERGVTGVDAHRDELLPFISPPHTLLVWRLVARLPYERAVYLWWTVLAISLLALVAGVLRGSLAPMTPLCLLSATLLAIAFAPISSNVALGQVALPAFLGAVLVMILSERRFVLAVLAAVLAFAQPNAALALAGQIGRNRATLAIVFGAALTYLLGSSMAGWSWPWAYAHAVAEHALAERLSAIQFGPSAIAFDFGATEAVATAVAVFAALLAIGAAIALGRAARDPFARFAGLSALVPFVAGFFHEHDFVVAFAAAVWSAVRTTGTTRAIALAGTLLVGFDWLGLAQRPTGIAQSALLEAALLAAFLALGKNRSCAAPCRLRRP
jgi:hypothetical protein